MEKTSGWAATVIFTRSVVSSTPMSSSSQEDMQQLLITSGKINGFSENYSSFDVF